MKIKDNIVEILIICGSILLLFFSSDPVIYSDSSRYVMSENLSDPPLYPIIIKLTTLIFGNLNFIVVLQTLFIGYSIIYFARTASIHFSLNLILKIFISLFLFLPILQFYNTIMTESFSYALTLLFVSFVIRLIFNFSIQNLIFTNIFVILLLLMRTQFLILYPVILILYSGILILNNSKKTFTLLLVSFLSVFLIHNLLISLNNYVIQKSSKTDLPYNVNLGPFFYTYIDAIYISSAKDVKLFENENSQKILTKIFEEMDNQKALVKYYNGRGHFGLSLSKIKNYSKPLMLELSSQTNTNIITLKKEISIILIKANFEKYIKLIFKKFYDSTWLFVFVPFFMLLASLINFIKYKTNFSLLVIFLSSFSIGNHSMVYLFGRVQPRYFIYTDFILLIFILIIFNIFLQKKEIG
jgi:hypothetical protein